ncbi:MULTISPECIES: FtsK/SpoIIIE domain-containing protein [Streptococcus]|uniref:FtsK/SpoIIIE domain-containing protein n=1 Tax=Streptococcus TaxID=1301 RepID=UPI0006182B41|nr:MULTISPECIES: FtsK/SpoIIIE domain-containing protein [Streptococcus]KKC19009.1 cell division protein FtsK [Streptococcus dysgalactiae subsp. equisimilis]MCY7234959.1 cell division protein FtsK [Streptococcus dysgalactiae]QQC49407.1 cell division protein FtsK [Streptococcus dysgalactiae]SUN65718.1 putative transposon protein; DNA segregation ATPase [Streptococcus dysgalactiae subsp. equisimilis]VUC97016.1 putative transposon protein; DNA segregation ATPase [Streptococcus sp. NCTC 11567]
MLWKKRGRRVRKYHKHIKGITLLILYMPFLLGSGFFLWMEKDNLLLEPVYYSVTTGTVLVIGLGLVFILNQLGYRNLLVFSKWNNLRIMANFLLENGYYTTKKIKRDKQVKEKIILPKVYLKQSKYGLKVSFILQGNKFQDRFLNLGNTLEIQHDGDFTGKKFTKGFVTYEIAIDQFAGRLNLEEVTVTKQGLRLMKDVYWDFVKQPHLLIGGGTGGGKTVLLMILLYGLAPISDIDICDPKQSDLSSFAEVPIFQGHVFITKEEIVNCLKDNVEEMEERYRIMKSHPDFVAGMNFSKFGLRPKFVFFDEWAALMAKLDGNYQLQQQVNQYLTQLILEARQAGIFVIMAMQRPDGEYIKTSLRDQFMKRLSVGHLEDTGYTMMYGDANRNKEFKYIDEIDGKKVVGRGYIANAGEIAREFFSPNVPFDKGFSFKDAFLKLTSHQDSVIISTDNETVESFVDFEPEQFTISEMKTKLDKTYDQVKKLVNLIEKGGYSTFTKEDGKMLFDKDDLYTLGVIFNSIDDTSMTYKEAVEAYYQSQKETTVEVS